MQTVSSDRVSTAGLEIVLPAIVSVERGDGEVLIAFATHDPADVIAPLIGRWLAGSFGATFLPAGDGDRALAGDVFYDKLSAVPGAGQGFVAVLAPGAPDGRMRGAFMQGGALVRWIANGTATAHVNLARRSAAIACDGLPGALGLRCGPVRGRRHSTPVRLQAWYGFGRALASPDAILDAIDARKRLRAERERGLDG